MGLEAAIARLVEEHTKLLEEQKPKPVLAKTEKPTPKESYASPLLIAHMPGLLSDENPYITPHYLQ